MFLSVLPIIAHPVSTEFGPVLPVLGIELTFNIQLNSQTSTLIHSDIIMLVGFLSLELSCLL